MHRRSKSITFNTCNRCIYNTCNRCIYNTCNHLQHVLPRARTQIPSTRVALIHNMACRYAQGDTRRLDARKPWMQFPQPSHRGHGPAAEASKFPPPSHLSRPSAKGLHTDSAYIGHGVQDICVHALHSGGLQWRISAAADADLEKLQTDICVRTVCG